MAHSMASAARLQVAQAEPLATMLQRGGEGGLGPGPPACRAGVMPLRHVPLEVKANAAALGEGGDMRAARGLHGRRRPRSADALMGGHRET